MAMNYRIQIDGVDKVGKDLVLKYVILLSNHKYVIQARGLMSQLAYSEIYERPYKYNLDNYRNDVFIYLYAEFDDLRIRHKITNEPKIDIERDFKVFNDVYEYLKNNNFKTYDLNMSCFTPYEAAKFIIEKMEELENEKI